MAVQTNPGSLDDSEKPENNSTRANQVAIPTHRTRHAHAVTPAAAVAAKSAPASKPAVSTAPKAKKPGRWRSIRSTAIMALVVPALFGTVALPAYAFTPGEQGGNAASSVESLKQSGAQSLNVDADVAATAVTRDGYSATTAAELATARAVSEATAQRATFVNTQANYAGPSASDLLANPPYPSFSLDQVFQVALQYQGVPYVYGGATPAGFDCSGFVMYVFAQFGINLPHSSTAQGNIGTRIAVEDAVPGDLVVSSGHIGFYAGNGMILHASRPGTPLRIGPIYASNWFVVRIGI